MRRIYVFVIAILWCSYLPAQDKIEGTWEGRLNVGTNSLRLIFHFTKDSAGYKGTLDSPDQGAKGIAFSKIENRNDSLLLEIATVGGKASGRFLNDSTFSGRWTQGMSFPFTLKKVLLSTTVNRPQTPKPPFPYKSEDVIYFNKDSSIQYGATVTVPNGEGPFPALILITGSGPQNRDEELAGHKPFAVIADYLTRQGYLVIRVDDRGVGKTTGNFVSATSKNFADDVNIGLDYLKKRTDVAKDKIGLLGHSEGGMIAQMVAADRSDVAFVISLAGPGQRIIDLMTDQNRAILAAKGIPKLMVEDYLKLYTPLVSAIAAAPSDSAASLAGTAIVRQWINATPKETVVGTTGITEENQIPIFVASFLKSIRTPWFTYFITYDPAPYIKKMKSNTLVLNGEKDIQVISTPNLEGWKTALAKSGVKKYDVIELKGLNHLFQRCTTCTLAEYEQLEETIAPEALEAISSWLKANLSQ